MPTVSLPSVNSWKNYISQSSLEEDGRYLWYGIDTGFTKDDEVIVCPEPTNCPTPNPADCSCPECPTSNTVGVSCPTPNPADCSCPESSNVFCPTYPMTTEIKPETTLTLGLTYTYVLRKSVSFSYFSSKSIFYSETIIGCDVTMIAIESFIYNNMLYIIRFYSLTKSPTYIAYEVTKRKNRITAEMLIGISCSSAAVFFIILACLIFYCSLINSQKMSDDISFSSYDDEKVIGGKVNDNGLLADGMQGVNIKNNAPQNGTSADDPDFWF